MCWCDVTGGFIDGIIEAVSNLLVIVHLCDYLIISSVRNTDFKGALEFRQLVHLGCPR